MSLTAAELLKLKKQLPKGAITKIAVQVGCSQPFVSLVLAGKRNSDVVVLRAIHVRDKEMARAAKIRAALRNKYSI